MKKGREKSQIWPKCFKGQAKIECQVRSNNLPPQGACVSTPRSLLEVESPRFPFSTALLHLKIIIIIIVSFTKEKKGKKGNLCPMVLK